MTSSWSLFRNPDFSLANPAAQELFNNFVAAYDQTPPIRFLLSKTSIREADITMTGAVRDIWLDLLRHAARGERLRELVEVAVGDDTIAAYHSRLQRLLDDDVSLPEHAPGNAPAPRAGVEPAPDSTTRDIAISFASEDRDRADSFAAAILRGRLPRLLRRVRTAVAAGRGPVPPPQEGVRHGGALLPDAGERPLQGQALGATRTGGPGPGIPRGQRALFPVWIDDTELPGPLSTYGYLDLREHSVDQLVELLFAKLKSGTAISTVDRDRTAVSGAVLFTPPAQATSGPSTPARPEMRDRDTRPTAGSAGATRSVPRLQGPGPQARLPAARPGRLPRPLPPRPSEDLPRDQRGGAAAADLLDAAHRGAPGSDVLPVLRSALLHYQGGRVTVAATDVRAARLVTLCSGDLERLVDADRLRTLRWYRQGLLRCRAVAALRVGDAAGTGVLVAGPALHTSLPPVVLLTTVSVLPERTRAADLEVVFPAASADQADPVRVEVTRVHRDGGSNAGTEIAVLELAPRPAGIEPAPLAPASPPADQERVYVVEQALGGDGAQFTLQDAALLGRDERLL
ncbi:MAG: hypothetical protein ACXWYP_04170, partial [Pseudonocardia sp.]